MIFIIKLQRIGLAADISVANIAEMVTVKEHDESKIKLSPMVAYVVGGSILGLLLLVFCIAATIILRYKKKPNENTESTLIRVDRMKRLNLSLRMEPLKLLVR